MATHTHTFTEHGHLATLSYLAAEHGGWDVRGQIDGQVVTIRHCSEWRGVERVQRWLQALLHERANAVC